MATKLVDFNSIFTVLLSIGYHVLIGMKWLLYLVSSYGFNYMLIGQKSYVDWLTVHAVVGSLDGKRTLRLDAPWGLPLLSSARQTKLQK